MSEEITKPAVQHNFMMKNLEKRLTIVVFLIFLFSLSGKYSMLWTIVLFLFTVIVIIYYIVWFKKKPAYVIMEDQRIIIHNLPFFKPCNIEKRQIEQVITSNRVIKINYKVQDDRKSISIYHIMLSEESWEQLTSVLKQQ